MTTYIALLRGINVSGKYKIKMADLRAELSGLDYQNLQTYIQSGNIVFEAPEQTAHELEEAIAARIQEAFGYEVPVLVMPAQELAEIAAQQPFLAEAEEDGGKVLFTILQKGPDQERLDQLLEQDYGSERFVVNGRTVYLHCPNGYGRAKLNNNFLERKFGVPATTRNWKTVKRLLEIAWD
jgi:uncharacterized protein (DUF1697 family)